MIRINRIPKVACVKSEILAKCNFFNARVLFKDRIGKRVVEDAEREGQIRPGDTFIESTSGNTGIDIALMVATNRYKCTI